jgi:hypothetical protein
MVEVERGQEGGEVGILVFGPIADIDDVVVHYILVYFHFLAPAGGHFNELIFEADVRQFVFALG